VTAGQLWAAVPGGRLWAQAGGSGPGVVLMHAGIADARMWDPQWEPLTAGHRVVRYDLRGFGRSQVEHVAFSNREDVLAVMDAAGLQQAVLVGCSRAGRIAIDTVLEFPDRVSGVVWVCGGLSGFEPDEASAAELEPFDEREEALAAAKDWAGAAELDARVWVDGPREPAGSGPIAVRDLVRTMCFDTYAAELPYGDDAELEPAAATRLSEIRVPLLAIVGGRDPLVTARTADVLLRGVAGARRIDRADVAHLPSLEQPAWFNETLLAFLAEVDGAARGT